MSRAERLSRIAGMTAASNALERSAAYYGRGYAINARTAVCRKFSTAMGTRPVRFATVGVMIA